MKNKQSKTIREICDKYSLATPLLVNVVDEVQTRNLISATMEIIAETLKASLGPDGAASILQGRDGKDVITKDGLDILNTIDFNQDVSRTILRFIKQVSSNQVINVGDGSTSAVVVSQALYEAVTNDNGELFDRVSPKAVNDILNALATILERDIKEKVAIQVTDEDYSILDKVATISTNNDEKTGKVIADAYRTIGKDGFLTIEKTRLIEEDEIELKKGVEWRRGFIADFFGNFYKNKKVEHKNPIVFITKSHLSIDDCDEGGILATLVGRCSQLNREFVLIAPSYSPDVQDWLEYARCMHRLPEYRDAKENVFTAVDNAMLGSTLEMNKMEDLALLCGCEIYDKTCHNAEEFFNDNARPYKFLGEAQSAVITGGSTQVIVDEDMLSEEHKARIAERADEFQTEIDEIGLKVITDYEVDKHVYNLKRRLSSLRNSTAILHVGGRTQIERNTRERLIEDAVLACKSAIDHGVVFGGNLVIPYLLENNLVQYVEELAVQFPYIFRNDLKTAEFFTNFLNIVKEAFLKSYKAVLANSGRLTNEEIDEYVYDNFLKQNQIFNAKERCFENIKDTVVINSAYTDINILRSCISIIGLIATSNQFIGINYNTYVL